MCDVKKYSKIYEEIKQLQPEDTLQLVLEAKNQEERDFLKWLETFCFKRNKGGL